MGISIDVRPPSGRFPRQSEMGEWWRKTLFALIPGLFLVVLYSGTFHIWFREADFTWLGLLRDVHSFRDLIDALFRPVAQGTIRPWSERGFFMLCEYLFGLSAVPFRLTLFLTVALDLLLLGLLTARLTSSYWAAVVATVLWVAHPAPASAMTWFSCYNEVQYPAFMLGALLVFIRYAETGRRTLWWIQLGIFTLGFGSLECEVVYPAIALSWVLLMAPRSQRWFLVVRTLPMFAVSALYTALHLVVAPAPSAGIYAPHFDATILRTLGEYSKWALVSGEWSNGELLGNTIRIILSVALLGFSLWLLRSGHFGIVFPYAWFLITLAPLLPFPDRHTEYYLTVPAMGLAILGGWAVTTSWRSGGTLRIAAVGCAILFVGSSIPVIRMLEHRYVEESRVSRQLVEGVRVAAEHYPDKILLLDGITPVDYRVALQYGAMDVIGVTHWYLTPESEERIGLAPDDPIVIDPAIMLHALSDGHAVALGFQENRLREITRSYRARAMAQFSDMNPHHIVVAEPLCAYLLGPEWAGPQDNLRWMPGTATLALGAPEKEGQRLVVSGWTWEEILKQGPQVLSVTANDIPLGEAEINSQNTHFRHSFLLPQRVVGKQLMSIKLTVHPVIHVGGTEIGLRIQSISVVKGGVKGSH